MFYSFNSEKQQVVNVPTSKLNNEVDHLIPFLLNDFPTTTSQ